MEEINGVESEKQKSQVAIQCAKIAILLSSLKSSPDSSATDSDDSIKSEEVDLEELRRELLKLKREMVKERIRNKKMRYFSAAELLVFLFCFWTLCGALLFIFAI